MHMINNGAHKDINNKNVYSWLRLEGEDLQIVKQNISDIKIK